MIKLEISETLARCLQRMLVDEIENQNAWMEEDRNNGLTNAFRHAIITECEKLIKELEKQGVQRHFKCF